MWDSRGPLRGHVIKHAFNIILAETFGVYVLTEFCSYVWRKRVGRVEFFVDETRSAETFERVSVVTGGPPHTSGEEVSGVYNY